MKLAGIYDGEVVANGTKCDYCNQGAIGKFKLMVIRNNRHIMWSGQWLTGCGIHWEKAATQARAGMKR